MSGKTIAVFDFDHTLVRRDSFWAFLALVAGWPRTLQALALSLLSWYRQTPRPEQRTFLKAQLINRLLVGRRVDSLAPALQALAARQEELASAVKLRAHHAAGHHVVIATGGLDLYIRGLLNNLPHHAVICTEIGVKDGVITGEMTQGNCVRERKAELVAAYLREHGPFETRWGYGNPPHDLPMLELMQHRVLI